MAAMGDGRRGELWPGDIGEAAMRGMRAIQSLRDAGWKGRSWEARRCERSGMYPAAVAASLAGQEWKSNQPGVRRP